MKKNIIIVGIMKYIALFIMLALMGCSSGKKQETASSPSGIPVINLSDNVLTVASLPLSEAVEKIEIVPLETIDESLIREITMMRVTDNNIWIESHYDSYIYHFSRSGKFLNRIGSIGNGPGEYLSFGEFLIDEDKKEVYIVSGSNGILIYNFEGRFERKLIDFHTQENLTTSAYTQYVLFAGEWFVTQSYPVYRHIDKDPLWSFASLGTNFQEKITFKNPAHRGREEQIIKNRGNMDRMVNYWNEDQINLEICNNQLTLKYPDTDTIYQYDMAEKKLFPQYAIYSREEKGDYEQTHLWFKDRKAFDYFSIKRYYPSKDFIYLIGTKGEEIYTYCYSKKDKNVRLRKKKGKITERSVPFFDIPLRHLPFSFDLENDICGGSFRVNRRSSGKYWIEILTAENITESLLDKIKASTMKDEAKRNELIQTLENMEEDSNPVLLIATLK